MIRSSFSIRLLVTLLLTAVAAVGAGTTARAAGSACSFPTITDVVAYPLTPDSDYLYGAIEPGAGCPTYGTLTSIDGTEELPVGDGSSFVLPLGTKSGQWYLSSFTVIDHVNGGSHTETFAPVAPYVVRVLHLTQIRSTSPDQYVGYGDQITVSGVLEGWADATGWQPLPGRTLTIFDRYGDDSTPTQVTTDQMGAYTATVRAWVTDAAGGALFDGDETWRRSFSWSGVQVHALITARSDQTNPVSMRPVRIFGTVAPGAMPVWLERLEAGEWVRVTDTVMADANGRYSLRYKPRRHGEQTLRVWTDGTNPDTREGVLPYWAELTIGAH